MDSSNMIHCHIDRSNVKVEGARTPRQILEWTGCSVKADDAVLATMPHGSGDKAHLYLFHVGRPLDGGEMDNEYEIRGLVPADPYTLAAFNQINPEFVEEHPNATYWRDSDGKPSCILFDEWHHHRFVNVSKDERTERGDEKVFGSRLWFAGLPK